MSSAATAPTTAAAASGVDATTTMLVEVAENTPKGVPRRRLVRQHTEKAVSKKMWDHFRDFSDIQKYVLTYEGITLEERLTRDTRDRRSGGITMGAAYYSKLRGWYATTTNAAAMLTAKDPNQPVRASLREAMKQFKARPCKRQPLIEWLRTNKYDNNREAIGLAKTFLEQNATKTHEQRELAMAFIHWVHLHNIKEKDSQISNKPYYD